MSYEETRRRSIAKALSWRVFATIVTAAVTYSLTKQILFALQLGLIDTVTKIGIYYLHERVWVRLPYGKVLPPDYQI